VNLCIDRLGNRETPEKFKKPGSAQDGNSRYLGCDFVDFRSTELLARRMICIAMVEIGASKPCGRGTRLDQGPVSLYQQVRARYA
jgi:hypothetical protein